MPSPIWVPGKAVYSEWLKTLTPEEKAQHLMERRSRKSMRKAYEQVIQAQQAEWISRINQGMVAVLQRAITTGDPAALTAVFDRIIGKPAETIIDESDRVLPWSDELPTKTNNDPV